MSYVEQHFTGTPVALRRSHELGASTHMALRPLGDRLIVRREASDDKSRGGIFLPENAKKKPQRGTVLAVGPGKMNDEGARTPLQVKVGDHVLFTAWAGDEFKDNKNKDEVLLMHETDVLAVMN